MKKFQVIYSIGLLFALNIACSPHLGEIETSDPPTTSEASAYIDLQIQGKDKDTTKHNIYVALCKITPTEPYYERGKSFFKSKMNIYENTIHISVNLANESETYHVLVCDQYYKQFSDLLGKDGASIFEEVLIHEQLNNNQKTASSQKMPNYQKIADEYIPAITRNQFNDLLETQDEHMVTITKENTYKNPALCSTTLDRILAKIEVCSSSNLLEGWQNPDNVQLDYKGFMVINCSQLTPLIQLWRKSTKQGWVINTHPYFNRERELMLPPNGTPADKKDYHFRWLLPEFVITDNNGQITGYKNDDVPKLFDQDAKCVTENNFNTLKEDGVIINKRYYTTGIIVRLEADSDFTLLMENGQKTIRKGKYTGNGATYFSNKEMYYTYYIKDSYSEEAPLEYHTPFRNKKYQVKLNKVQGPGGVYPFADLVDPTSKDYSLTDPKNANTRTSTEESLSIALTTSSFNTP